MAVLRTVCALAVSALAVTTLSGTPTSARQADTPRATPRNPPYTTWSDYAGSADSMQYSALEQIDKRNVGQLELAWFHPVPDRTGNFGFSPLVVDGVMYVLGAQNAIVALDAATGTQVWAHTVDGGSPGNRGINYWESKDRSERRLIYAAGGALREIDARTGAAISTFGDNGRVVMRSGFPRVLGGPSGTPGRVFENLIITGSNTGEGYFSAPGDIRAFDVLTGKLVWTFHTIPRPGEYGYDTWPPDAWKYAGGVNCWGGISVDERRGIVYIPLGSPTHDMFGGDRKGGNLFGNSLVALDARTGKRLWHFQTVHHDLWDYDLTAAPTLMTVRHNGRMVDVVAQAGKTGFLYVFDRVTGAPVWPIEERPVPASDVKGEAAWPTQPFPAKPAPFARQSVTVNEINPFLDPEEARQLRQRFLAARNEGIFTPPTLDREQIMLPGQFGGANWGGPAADPTSGMLFVPVSHHPTIHQLREYRPNEPAVEGPPEVRGRAAYQRLCLSCHGEPEAGTIRTMDRAGTIVLARLTGERFRTQIRQGQGQMPPFAPETLTEPDLRGVLAYLGVRDADSAAAAIVDGPRPGEPAPLSARDEGLALFRDPRYTGPLGRAFRTENGMTAIAPPWSEIVAYDLNEGTIKWRVPVGTSPALAARGIKDTGNGRRFWRNGPVVTAGGLLFIGTWADRTVRALETATGAVLWERALDANPEGLAAVFEANGRQYVAFCASGTGKQDTPVEKAFEARPGLASAQGYYVFALPQTPSSGR
jgi:quinoprotein glucose dehydrogenase